MPLGVIVKSKTLARSSSDKLIAGVCGGVAERFGLSPTLVRLAFLLLAAIEPSFLLLYLLLALVMPKAGSEDEPLPRRVHDTLADVGSSARRWRSKAPERKRFWLGVGLVALGGVLLAQELGFFWFDWSLLGPLTLVALGLVVLLGGRR